MEDLVRAETGILETADWATGRNYFRERLEDLNARHALLMHAAVLDDAHLHAAWLKHYSGVAIAQATMAPADKPRTAAEVMAEHDAFMEQVTAVENAIDHVVDTQRQMTRDALHRLFPRITGIIGLDHLRTVLVDRSRLGLDDRTRAYEAITNASHTLGDLQRLLKSGHVVFGQGPVTEEQVTHAGEGLERAQQYFADLEVSRKATLRALKAVDSVADLSPTQGGGRFERAAQIAAASRRRTEMRGDTHEHKGGVTAGQQHAQPLQPQHPGPRSGRPERPTVSVRAYRSGVRRHLLGLLARRIARRIARRVVGGLGRHGGSAREQRVHHRSLLLGLRKRSPVASSRRASSRLTARRRLPAMRQSPA